MQDFVENLDVMPSITMENNVIHNNEGYGVIIVKPSNLEEWRASQDASEGTWSSQYGELSKFPHCIRPCSSSREWLRWLTVLFPIRTKAAQLWSNTGRVQIGREERPHRRRRRRRLGKEVAVQSPAEPEQGGGGCAGCPGSAG